MTGLGGCSVLGCNAQGAGRLQDSWSAHALSRLNEDEEKWAVGSLLWEALARHLWALKDKGEPTTHL